MRNSRKVGLVASLALSLIVSGGIMAAPASAATSTAAATAVAHPNYGGCFYGITCKPPKGPSGAEQKCQKAAVAAGLIAMGGTLASTTPVNMPGIVTVGAITYLGTRYFCTVGW